MSCYVMPCRVQETLLMLLHSIQILHGTASQARKAPNYRGSVCVCVPVFDYAAMPRREV